jgi:hypothetical protein
VVVRHADGGGVEGVGANEVGAGVQVLRVDVADDVWLREAEQVVVALDQVRPVLEALAAVLLL